MDGAGTRSQASGRRMASSRTAPTARSRGGQGAADAPELLTVSPARWIGVALVFGALLTAMTMAATSTARPGPEVEVPAVAVTSTPSPAPFVGEDVPTEVPVLEIAGSVTDPSGALLTSEREVSLGVTIPPTTIPSRQLTLEILHEGEVVQSIKRPGERAAPRPLALKEGRNLVGARLRGPRGPGPAAERQVVLDTREPSLTIGAPRENHSVEEDSVTLRGESDPGTRLTIVNKKTRREVPHTVGPAGSWEAIVFLEPGENLIRVRAADPAGNVAEAERTVNREGAGVRGEITVQPQRLEIRKLPAPVRISARLRDKDGKPVADAEVTFTLSIPGQPTEQSPRISTGRDGTASWRPEVGPEGIEKGDAQIAIDAMLPTGGRYTKSSKRLTIE